MAYRGVTEQREELEKPGCLKANHISSEYPVRLRRGSFIRFSILFHEGREAVGIDRFVMACIIIPVATTAKSRHTSLGTQALLSCHSSRGESWKSPSYQVGVGHPACRLRKLCHSLAAKTAHGSAAWPARESRCYLWSGRLDCEDVINPHIIRVLFKKFLDTISQVPNHHDQPPKPLYAQIVDQPFEDWNTSHLSEALGASRVNGCNRVPVPAANKSAVEALVS